MDDLITEFLTETNESLEELDQDLVNLEQNPNDKDLLGKIFRLKHTIKGTCGFLGLPRLEKVAHHAENVLGRFRDGDLEVTPEYVTLIFESIDRIKEIVAALGETGKEPAGDDSELIKKLDAVYEGRSLPKPVEQPKATAPKEEGGGLSQAELDALEAAFNSAEGPAEFALKNPPPPPEAPKAQAPKPQAKKAEAAPAGGGDGDGHGGGVGAQSLRVNVDVLENLMTMVSELVLTRNQLLQILRMQNESEFATPLQRLNHVVSDLQEGVMKTRMQPIGAAWAKLPRIIRDLSIELGKKIDLEMHGQDTELDRQVLELIKDPLTHMVRNSGDHGIETPEVRKAAGKPETGKIVLNAYHEGGHIIIEINDDGKGLPLERIKAKIIEKGLASEDEVASMTPSQIHQYIFKAGFSTAEKITSVSGRGVGMDVVRTNIERIGGSIELRSQEGKGSSFIIKIPLTLAIVSALIVEATGERFAIPQLSVRELVMASTTGENRIETIKGTPVFRLRNRLLPLVSLSDLLRLKQDKKFSENVINLSDSASRHQYIIVTQVGNNDFGIIVDRVYDTEEIVVKPVAKILRNIELFSGNTILGDGTVIMILDPNGIARQIGKIDESSKAAAAHAAQSASERYGQKTSLLLFEAGGNDTPKAVPLSLVARLENIDLKSVERSGGQIMVQYRGQLMPLLPFDSSAPIEREGEKPVLVFSDKKRSMGLMVDRIVDIIEEYIDVQLDGGQSGVLGSAIIAGRATDVVDVGHFLQSTNREWFKDHGDDPFLSAGENGEIRTLGTSHGKKRILLVDDSPFFRNMLTPLLSVAGYDVVSLESPQEALKMCERGAEFDMIISDIEMPDMDGFEFAERVKNGSNWAGTPMVALSSHATPQDISRGMEVGFTKYVAKFDRDTLLNTLSQTFAEQRQERHAANTSARTAAHN
jgi:two-component system, chemotaxis family, sensor kinase CheA